MSGVLSSDSSDSSAGPSRQVSANIVTESSMAPLSNGKARANVSLDQVYIDTSRLDHDLDLLISQYLHTRSRPDVARAFDEELLGFGKGKERNDDVEEVERAILDGEYGLLENLIARPGLLKPQSQRAFLYLCYRQQFLEYIENRESQKAFNLLQKRLKPLEHYQPVPYDFYNLCYLTSAGTVHDAPTLKDWAGVRPERERLVETWKGLTDLGPVGETGVELRDQVPPNRLLTLMKQAAAWQVANAKRVGTQPWTLKSLLHDYAVRSVPNRKRLFVQGHSTNIKCVDLIGREEPEYIVTGSSDTTLKIFSNHDGMLQNTLRGHTSRIWDCAVSTSTSLIASGSGDGTVRIWSARSGACQQVLAEDGGDVYSVRWRPDAEDELVTASYDRILRSWNAETGQQIRTFSGHSQSTLAVAYDPTGRLLASGSKDKHVRLWDAIGGTCIKTLTASLGEITSVDFDADGKYLLAGCKDNSNRLWDLRMQRNLYRYIGHQNTSKNLVRCSFAGSESDLVIGGSEDGKVYIWHREPSTPAPIANGMLQPNHSLHAVSPSSMMSLPTNDAASILAKSSPAYYPPKSTRPAKPSAENCVNVRPIQILDGHEQGAVFDVKWRDDELVSVGEDGYIGFWEAEEA